MKKWYKDRLSLKIIHAVVTLIALIIALIKGNIFAAGICIALLVTLWENIVVIKGWNK